MAQKLIVVGLLRSAFLCLFAAAVSHAVRQASMRLCFGRCCLTFTQEDAGCADEGPGPAPPPPDDAAS